MQTRISYRPANQCDTPTNIGDFECHVGAFNMHVYEQMMQHLEVRDELCEERPKASQALIAALLEQTRSMQRAVTDTKPPVHCEVEPAASTFAGMVNVAKALDEVIQAMETVLMQV